ncbi:MAG: DNA alkylation repair protein [Bacteroidales bacterium]|nr:DNA alkylation repair protein [Bacteroidales bacterium]
MKAQDIVNELALLRNPEKAAHDQIFFKTAKGQYGEGDVFAGVAVPELRRLSRKYKMLPVDEIEILVKNPVHEARFIALLLLIENYKKGATEKRKEIVDLYLSFTEYINNWDLVDVTAPHILGPYLYDNPPQRKILYDLVNRNSLWEQRMAIIATLGLIRRGVYEDSLRLSEILLLHPHDLIHKAVGWTLREVGKRDKSILVDFLNKYAVQMPRTALRYAIEHMEKEERTRFLSRK